MINVNSNNFFSDNETQDPLKREEFLFNDIGSILKKVCDISTGWRNILTEIDFDQIQRDIETKLRALEAEKVSLEAVSGNIKILTSQRDSLKKKNEALQKNIDTIDALNREIEELKKQIYKVLHPDKDITKIQIDFLILEEELQK